ncbi:MAG: MarR family winged helix-turn-helix transcriptional regulator, partial [bacterium]
MSPANSSDDKFFQILMKTSSGLRHLIQNRADDLGLNQTEARILMFVIQHPDKRSTITNMATEFNRTKPTISNHVDSLVEQGLLDRTPSAEDRRRTDIAFTRDGRSRARKLLNWPENFTPPSDTLSSEEMASIHEYLLSFLDRMHELGDLPVAKTCTSCRYLSTADDDSDSYYCEFLDISMGPLDLRVDCEVHERAIASSEG